MKNVLLALVLLLAACGHAGTTPPIPVNHGTNYGVVIEPATLSADTTAASLTDIAHNLRAQNIRVDYEPTQFDYSWVPTAIADGLRIDFITPYIPFGTAITPAYIAAYAQTVADLVRMYPHQIIEVYNEPNIQESAIEAKLTPQNYIDLANAVVPAVRAADPTALISSGGTSGVDLNWFAATLSVYAQFDCVGVHPYEYKPAQFGAMIASIALTVRNKPVCITEWGESPQVPADLTAAASAVNDGYVPIFDVFELDDPVGAKTLFGLRQNPAAYAAYAGAIIP